MFTRRDFLRTSGLASVYLTLTAGSNPLAAGISSRMFDHMLREDALASDASTDETASVVHLLNRITWGPRPGDVEAVIKQGYDAFIDEQLHPETIDDSEVQQRIAGFDALKMSSAELWSAFPSNGSPPPTRIIDQLHSATLLRAIYSKRQLFEIMVDFWSNHFNIDVKKKRCRWLKVANDQDVIRPHALGKFRDLLLAVAQSPAMLISLDNNENVAPHIAWGGINENYARELMELHTVGVDGGYTQEDVQTVALALTGWGVASPKEENPLEFVFHPDFHDERKKKIPFLKLTLPANGGIKDGEKLLKALAIQPQTARRIAYKLAVTFVADDPPADLVERAAQVYLDSDTDIRATLATILKSDAFKQSAGQKFKLPLRLLVSMLRTLDADCKEDAILRDTLIDLGQPLFGWSAPDGYPQVGAAWVNTGGMLARWNLAFALSENRLKGVTYSVDSYLSKKIETAALVDKVAQGLNPVPLPKEARSLLIDLTSAGKGANFAITPKQMPEKIAELSAILLASPLFQFH